MIIGYIGDYCHRTIDMSFKSVLEADKIIFVWGGECELTKDKLEYWSEKYPDKFIILQNIYNQEDKGMNGKARNVYLEYARKNFPDEWMLVCDPDEVVEDLSKIKEMIQHHPGGLWSVKMRHLIGDLGHEDSVSEEHYALNRLFKISDALEYPKKEHPVLKGVEAGHTRCTTIWHLAYIQNMWEIKKRYENHTKKSQIHTPQFLKNWYYQHLFGQYPRKSFNILELPKVITDDFDIDRDELYFSNRGLEYKHWLDALHWKEHFQTDSATIFGCGRGPRVYTLNKLAVDTIGFELSKYAVEHSLDSDVRQGDIVNPEDIYTSHLAVAYDLLEHLEYEDLDKAIETLKSTATGYILISVPFKGTPNCDADPTHIIKEDREWWVKQFVSKGLKEVAVPEHFLFKEQLMIFEK